MRMVIVKKVNKVEDLAMFLRTYKKETKPKGFKFTLVNSHGKGKKDKKVDTIKDKVVQVNYLSLYFKGIYTVSTTVESADYTSRLGIFLHDGIKDGFTNIINSFILSKDPREDIRTAMMKEFGEIENPCPMKDHHFLICQKVKIFHAWTGNLIEMVNGVLPQK